MAGELVLLTGATGYLGYLTLIELLKKGYQVRAAVRSQAKIAKVEAAPSFKSLSPSVEWVIVPDMTADGAYTEAAKGVKCIVHVASPIPTFGDEPIPPEKLEEYFLHPAAKGDLEVLEAAQQSGTVKRIVVTSSTVAITPFEYYLGTADYSKELYPDSRIPDVKGPFGFEFQAYAAGKAAALNASEAWMASHKPKFDLISVVPGWIFGRDELLTSASDATKGSTNSVLLNLLLGSKNEAPYNGNIVRGDDVAKIQVLALDPQVKGNQSFIASVDFEWEDAIEFVKKAYPREVEQGIFSTEGKQPTAAMKYSTNTTTDTFGALGFTFAEHEEVVMAVADQYVQLVKQSS